MDNPFAVATGGLGNLDTSLQCSLCGNGMKEDGEECDDGNKKNCDGCDSNCHTEHLSLYQKVVECTNIRKMIKRYVPPWEKVEKGISQKEILQKAK